MSCAACLSSRLEQQINRAVAVNIVPSVGNNFRSTPVCACIGATTSHNTDTQQQGHVPEDLRWAPLDLSPDEVDIKELLKQCRYALCRTLFKKLSSMTWICMLMKTANSHSSIPVILSPDIAQMVRAADCRCLQQ